MPAQDNPWLTVPIAARFYIMKSGKTVARMCREGVFKTARQVGGPKSHWQILRREVIQHCGKAANQQL